MQILNLDAPCILHNPCEQSIYTTFIFTTDGQTNSRYFVSGLCSGPVHVEELA